MNIRDLIVHGNFTLNSGEKTDQYFDIKQIVSYPNLLSRVITKLENFLPEFRETYCLCGVPTGGVPLATALSLKTKVPQIMLRKQRKTHGTGKLVEGNLNIQKSVVLVEDVVTTGKSVHESIDALRVEGFEVIKVISVVNRGNIEIINGVPHQSLYDGSILKETPVILAYDKPLFQRLITLINAHHSKLLAVKVHSEITNFNQQQYAYLREVCEGYGLFLWEDRKFNDIRHTVEKQLAKYEACRDAVTMAPFGDNGDILSIETPLKKILVCEMSNSKTENDYKQMIKDNLSNIYAIVCQSDEMIKFGLDNNLKVFVPGVTYDKEKRTDDKGQRYRTPDEFPVRPTAFVMGRSFIK